MTRTPKRPRDPNQLAKLIVDLATGEKVEATPTSESQRQVISRKAGKIGGPARAKALTKDQRIEIAKKAAKTRWSSDS